jgi:hypothetical protein
LSAESKKETAKVPVGAPASKAGLPQATVQLQKKPPVSTSASASKSVPPGAAISVAPQPAAPAAGGEITPVIGGAALGLSLIAFAIQLWVYFS